MNNKLYKKLLWGIGVVIVAVILTLFIVSRTYIQNLVYHERLNQMEEVTHQMFRSLEDVIDTHWSEVNVQCNYLYCTPLKTDTEFYRYLKKLSELSNYHERQIELIAVDSAGHYYTENARWTLAFLVPAEYVAVNTQKLVNIVMVIIIVIAMVFSVITVFVGWSLLRQKQQQELQAEKEANLRLEQYNIQLTQANDEMRRAQDAAAEALQSAERASKAKTDFLANMSHDIRTPMNAIIGITTLMKNELHQPEKLAEHLGKLESSGQLLLGIINDILDMSRIESGKTTLNEEKMNLSQQISQLDSIIRQQAGQRRQTFTVETHLQHENVLADPNRLNRVLMNILSNAVKYTPTGGHIRFEVDELPRNEHYARYRFVVQDDGIGMSEAYQKTLFDPFTREERSGTNKVQGTGLGMAITKSIVDLMGGSIGVESATGKGTRFEVVLEFPIDAEADHAQQVQALPEEAEETSPLCGMKFLCAEDNAINAEILEMLLEANGASCTICSNGQEIVDAFASVKPGDYDMILMDVQMPVMDGLEATRRIRSGENPLGRIIPILAMTANAFLEDMQKSREAGMDEHLSKPVDIAALEQTVKRFRVTPPRK